MCPGKVLWLLLTCFASTLDAVEAAACDREHNAGAARLTEPSSGPIKARFGPAFDPLMNSVRLHTGWDYAAATGDPVHAAAAGRVTSAGVTSGYGKLVVLEHLGGVGTAYAHLSAIGVAVGACVERGQVIGAAGSTGLSSSPHLHFEVRNAGSPVDPASWLSRSRRD